MIVYPNSNYLNREVLYANSDYLREVQLKQQPNSGRSLGVVNYKL